jgi:hypothetical protein
MSCVRRHDVGPGVTVVAFAAWPRSGRCCPVAMGTPRRRDVGTGQRALRCRLAAIRQVTAHRRPRGPRDARSANRTTS